MPEYQYVCAGCGPFYLTRSMTDDTPPRCVNCNTKWVTRRLEPTGVVYPTGRQSDRVRTDREHYRHERDALIRRIGKKRALAEYDTMRVDPDATGAEATSFKPTVVDQKKLERDVASTEAGRRLLSAADRGALKADSAGNLTIDD